LEDRPFDVRAMLGPIKRQLGLMLAVFVVLMTVSGLGVIMLRPVYTSTALVQVDTTQKNLLDAQSGLPGLATDSGRIDGEVELAQSDTVLLRAIRDGNLLIQGSFVPKPTWLASLFDTLGLKTYAQPTGKQLLDDVLDRLSRAVSVERRGLTFLIAVDARSESPDEAAAVANLIAQTYIATQLDGKVSAVLRSRDIIQARVADVSRALAASEDALDAFVDTNAASLAASGARADLAAIVAQLQAKAIEAEQVSTTIGSATSSLASSDWQSLTTMLQSDALRSLEERRLRTEGLLAEASPPESVNLRAELADIEADLRGKTVAAIADLKNRSSVLASDQDNLRAKLASSDLASDLTSTQLTELYQLQQTARIARSQYDTLLARLKDLESQAYLQVADSRVVSEAIAPRRPSFPNMGLLFAMAAVVSMFAAVVLAFVRENFVGGIVSADQTRDLLKVESVVTVPRQRDFKGARSLPDLIGEAPLSVYSEAIRKIRLCVDQARGMGRADMDAQVILITSANPGEGKSTIALSLGHAYAQSGTTTLVIDCDLRKPSLHKLLDVPGENGLLDFLQATDDEKTLDSVVYVDPSNRLEVVVGAGRSLGATEELVTGAKFRALISVARQSFGVVILDTPPLGPVVDGAYLARFADTVVLVNKWASTSQSDARNAIATIRASARPETPVVAVLNQSADASRASGRFAEYYAS
jgi:succinoglycan biosynthesis transport protein ExoP